MIMRRVAICLRLELDEARSSRRRAPTGDGNLAIPTTFFDRSLSFKA